MIVYGIYSLLLKHPLSRNTVLTGEHLHQLTGPISIRDDAVLRAVAREIIKLQPFIVYKPLGKISALEALANSLDIDESRNISILLNGNATVVLIGKLNGRPVVIHCGSTAKAISSIKRHKVGLEQVGNLKLDSYSRVKLPKIISFNESANRCQLTQERMEGAVGLTYAMSEKEFRKKMNQLFEFAISLSSQPSPAKQSMQIESIVKSLRSHLSETHFSEIRGALHAVEAWSINAKHGPIFVHGDLWLGNGLFDRESNLVSVIDWEWASESGFPLYDIMHCLVVSTAIYRSCSVISIIQAIWQNPKGDEWLELALSNIRQRSGVTPKDQKFIAAVIWLSIVRRTHIDTGPASAEWLREHLSQPTQVFLQYLSLADSKDEQDVGAIGDALGYGN